MSFVKRNGLDMFLVLRLRYPGVIEYRHFIVLHLTLETE
jgi:hypothetical protein